MTLPSLCRLEDSSDSDDEMRKEKISEMFNSSYTEVPSPDDSEEDPLDSFMAQIEVTVVLNVKSHSAIHNIISCQFHH